MTVSMSLRVLSRRRVRSVSAVLSSAVSVASWSMRAKAREKEASMEALSEASCGGLGGR